MLVSPLVIRVVAVFALNVSLLAQANQDVKWGRSVVGSIPVQAGAARDPARLSVHEVIVSGTGVQDGGVAIAIWDPISGRFWWTYQLPDRSRDLDSLRAYVVSEYHIIAEGSRTVVFVCRGTVYRPFEPCRKDSLRWKLVLRMYTDSFTGDRKCPQRRASSF